MNKELVTLRPLHDLLLPIFEKLALDDGVKAVFPGESASLPEIMAQLRQDPDRGYVMTRRFVVNVLYLGNNAAAHQAFLRYYRNPQELERQLKMCRDVVNSILATIG